LNLYAMVGNEVLNAYDVLGRLKGVGA
jgi:hypothetical protein